MKENARNKYRKSEEEEKEAKKAYGRDRQHNMMEDEKNKLKEYERNCKAARKTNINKNRFHDSKRPIVVDS